MECQGVHTQLQELLPVELLRMYRPANETVQHTLPLGISQTCTEQHSTMLL